MLCGLRLQIFKSLITKNSQGGMTLLETLVALAIMGAVAVTFLTGLAMSSKAAMISQERVAAESLAQSQTEYVKMLPYDDGNNPPVYEIDPSLTIPAGYTLQVSAERVDIDPDTTGDDGLQKITVVVTRDDDTLFTVISYKRNSNES